MIFFGPNSFRKMAEGDGVTPLLEGD